MTAGSSTKASIRIAPPHSRHSSGSELEGSELRLRNCPFHALVSAHTQLVCGMNLALLEGVVAGLQMPGARPVLAPRPGLCCVCIEVEAGEPPATRP